MQKKESIMSTDSSKQKTSNNDTPATDKPSSLPPSHSGRYPVYDRMPKDIKNNKK